MTKKQQTILILILGGVAALGPFSIDMYLPGFPAIAEDFAIDKSQVALTLTSYFIGISAGQLIYGPLLDRFGRKKPLLIGLAIYLISTLGCALAPNIDWLIGFRGLMAIGGCAGMVASRAIIRDSFPVHEIARVFSALILVMGVAPIVAPMLGGIVIEAFGWRFVFVLLTFFSAIIMAVLYFFLKESKTPDPEMSLQPVKVAIEYWIVLKNKQFLIYGLAGSAAIAGMFAYIADSSFLFMKVYGFSKVDYGWIFGGNAAGFILASQINRYILKKYDPRTITAFFSILMAGLSIVLLGGGLLQSLSSPIGIIILQPPLLFTLLFMFMFFLGFINPNTQAVALEPFSRNAGIASALVGSFRMFSGAIASALISVLHDGGIRPMVMIICFCSVLTMVLLLSDREKSVVE